MGKSRPKLNLHTDELGAAAHERAERARGRVDSCGELFIGLVVLVNFLAMVPAGARVLFTDETSEQLMLLLGLSVANFLLLIALFQGEKHYEGFLQSPISKKLALETLVFSYPLFEFFCKFVASLGEVS